MEFSTREITESLSATRMSEVQKKRFRAHLITGKPMFPESIRTRERRPSGHIPGELKNFPGIQI